MEKKINIENYEAFLLDLAEGNLSLTEEKQLVQFLANHPELDVDLEELPVLEEEAISLGSNFKSTLLKNPSSGLSERDHLMIASIEGKLSVKEGLDLNKLLETDQLARREYATYQKTKLEAESIEYPLKDQLFKKERKVIPLWSTISSIAAAVLFLIYFGWSQKSIYTPREFSYQPQEIEDVSEGFAFVIEDDKEIEKKNNQEFKPAFKTETIQPKGDQYLAENPEATKGSDSDEFIENEKAPIVEEIKPLDRKSMAEIQLEELEVAPRGYDMEVNESELATLPLEDQSSEEISEGKEVLNPIEYARLLIKKDVLKSRSLAESVKEEVSRITNEKVSFDQSESESEAQFALNIGKLQFRKK